jgi:arsenite methyltransferase
MWQRCSCGGVGQCLQRAGQVGGLLGGQRLAQQRQRAAHGVERQTTTFPGGGASVNVVISNCVINLSVDKPAVLAEMFRVLMPVGRIGISDVVAEDQLTPADRAAAGSYVGCIAGALSRAEYLDGLAAAGFVDPSVTFTTRAAPGLRSAIIRAVKPAQ